MKRRMHITGIMVTLAKVDGKGKMKETIPYHCMLPEEKTHHKRKKENQIRVKLIKTNP